MSTRIGQEKIAVTPTKVGASADTVRLNRPRVGARGDGGNCAGRQRMRRLRPLPRQVLPGTPSPAKGTNGLCNTAEIPCQARYDGGKTGQQ